MAADSALESVITQGTGTSAALSNQPVAGKTGTTNNETDKWFCGFTPYYTASIWLGYDDNSKVFVQVYQPYKDLADDYVTDSRGTFYR